MIAVTMVGVTWSVSCSEGVVGGGGGVLVSSFRYSDHQDEVDSTHP